MHLLKHLRQASDILSPVEARGAGNLPENGGMSLVPNKSVSSKKGINIYESST